MTPSIYNRLFVDNWDLSPAGFPLAFTNAIDVGDYFGKTSTEYAEAKTYFSNNVAGSTMYISRIGLGQRPHLLGADLSNLTMAQLHAINGSISITFDGFTYSTNVNLSTAANLTAAAATIRDAFTANLASQATQITGWMESKTINFTGSAWGAGIFPDAGSPSLEIGGVVHGAGLNETQSFSQIIRYKGGIYYTFANTTQTPTPDEPMTETYSILHTSAAITLGDRVAGDGIVPLSGVIGFLGIDGQGLNEYLVNQAQDRPQGTMNITPPALTVDYKSIPGVTHAHDLIEIQPNGAFGFDEITTNDLSYASGPVADALGLSQASGAIDSYLGGYHGTFAQYMNMEVTAANGSWASFQTSEPRLDHSAELWQQSHSQYAFIPLHSSTYPAGQISPSVAPSFSDFALMHGGGSAESITYHDPAHGAQWTLAESSR